MTPDAIEKSKADALAQLCQSPLPLWQDHDGPPPQGAYVAVIDGTLVSCFGLTVPRRVSAGARQSIIRSLLQKQMVDPEADPLIRVLDPQTGAPNGVTLIASKAALPEPNAQCKAMVPDYLILPNSTTGWVMALHDGRVLCRTSANTGWSLEPALAKAAVALTAPDDRPTTVTLLNARDVLGPIVREFSISDVLQTKPLTRKELFAGNLFAKEKATASVTDISKRYARHLMAASVAFLALGSAFFIQSQRLKGETDRLTSDTTRLAQSYFLGNATVLSLRAQVARAQSQNSNAAIQSAPQGTYSKIMGGISEPLMAAGMITLQVSIQAPNTLDLQVQANSLSDLDQFTEQVRALGFRVSQTGSQLTEAGQAVARLTVNGGS